jgi:hypothetical protein
VRTTADDQGMVQISKDALGDGVPNKDTFLTDYHMVYHPKYNDGKGVQASQLVNGDDIKYVAYDGHVYNVLFDRYEHIRGHNLFRLMFSLAAGYIIFSGYPKHILHLRLKGDSGPTAYPHTKLSCHVIRIRTTRHRT